MSYDSEPWVASASEDPTSGESPTPTEPPSAPRPGAGGAPPEEAALAQGGSTGTGEEATEPSAALQGMRADAYVALSQAIKGLRERGKRSTAAGVKTEMQKLTAGGFHEQGLGFDSFREFLQAAKDDGVIQLSRPAPGSGLDVEAFLPGERVPSTDETRQRPPEPQKGRIRADLWAAFVDHDPEWFRVFDLGTKQVNMFPVKRRPLEPPEVTVLRQRYEESPEKFKEIKFIPPQSKIDWMTRFAEDLEADDPARQVLSAALTSERPLSAFTRAAKGLPGVAERWRTTFAARITAVITEWLAEHDLQLDIYDEDPRRRGRTQTTSQEPSQISRARPVSQPSRVGRPASPSTTGVSDPLRVELLSVLGQLSTDELLQLKVPIVYALRK